MLQFVREATRHKHSTREQQYSMHEGGPHLARRQPERPLARDVLAQHGDHALQRAEHGAVHDDGTVGGLCTAA